MRNKTKLKFASISTPYIAILVGLFVFKNAFVAISIYYCGIIIVMYFDKQDGLLKSLVSGWNWIIAIMTVTAGGFSGAIVLYGWDFAKLSDVNLIEIFAMYGLQGSSIYIFVSAAITLNPLLEELFWRGYLVDARKGPSWIDAAFAGYHVPALLLVIKPLMATLAFIVLCIAGWGLRLIGNKLDGLLLPYLGHLAADVSIIAAIYFIII